MDDLTALRSFVAVIDHGSVAEAAHALGYSASAVSRHLATLEQEFGISLFERTGRSLRPSMLARVVSDKARLLVEEANQFSRDLATLSRGEEGVVRLAYFRAAGTTIVPIALSFLGTTRPAVTVTLIQCALSEEVVDILHRGEADLGVVWGFPDPEAEGLECSPILRDALLLLTSLDREDLHEDPTDLTRLVGEPFSAPIEHRGSPPIVDEMFHQQGLPAPTVARRTTDHAMSKSLIAAGVVVSLIPALGVSDASPGIRRSVVVDDFRHIYLARRPSQSSPLVPVLAQAMRAAARDYRGFGVEYVS